MVLGFTRLMSIAALFVFELVEPWNHMAVPGRGAFARAADAKWRTSPARRAANAHLPPAAVDLCVGILARRQTLTLSASDQRHAGGHQRHKLDVSVQRKTRHIENGSGDMLQLHSRFRLD